MNDQNRLEILAASAHMANRAYCIALGDSSQPTWESAPEWMKTSAINGAKGVLAGNSPRESHELWLSEKLATGWKYGQYKNIDKKEHPCCRPYNELPSVQQLKDYIFVATVRSVAEVLGLQCAVRVVA